MRAWHFRKDILLILAIALPLTAAYSGAQQTNDLSLQPDSDHDGLSDALEQQLLNQFAPSFMIAEHDCSVSPAEFRTNTRMPVVEAENGTIYGQVFRAKDQASGTVEIHFYHLWRKDCGEHSHALDTEHVAVLVKASDANLQMAKWKAVYWYAAAHENTVCDVSQIARASTLQAETHGATVWISPGKHASYLNSRLCAGGCGADRCEKMVPLQTAALINLGEPGHPMNQALFTSSSAWPLAAKMLQSNFPSAPVARLNELPTTDIAWFSPGRHPMQGVIARSASTEQAIAGGGRSTTTALSLANDSTGNALSTAGDSTGNALQKSYRHTRHALGTSARHVGEELRIKPKDEDKKPE